MQGGWLAAEIVEECGRSQEGYNRIMEPIRAQQEKEEVSAFNADLRALPLRIIPKDRYETVPIEVLNSKYECCFLHFTDATEASKHPLFGKRYRVLGKITYHPKDSEDKPDGSLSIQAEDVKDQNNTWYLDVDIESLSREERAFIRDHCVFLYAFDECAGDFFGVIGRVERRPLEVLGLQVEYMKLSPREPKKAS